MRYAVAVLLLLAACAKSPTQAAVTTRFVDPTVLIINGTSQDTASLSWAGSHWVGGNITNILPGQSACAHFDALPDSAYFAAVFRGPENVYYFPALFGPPPHFDPSAHPYWTISTADIPDTTWGAILAISTEVSSPPC